MSDQTRVALDQTACIRSQSNIGETIVHNICDGTTAVVPWGSVDWVVFGALALFILACVVVIAVVAAALRELFQ